MIGGGVAGFNAAKVAVGIGAEVTILEKDHDRMRFLDDYFRGAAQVVYSSRDAVEKALPVTDFVIGAVLIPGASAPQLVSRANLKTMMPGAVMVDIAIDQGGCFETSKRDHAQRSDLCRRRRRALLRRQHAGRGAVDQRVGA